MHSRQFPRRRRRSSASVALIGWRLSRSASRGPEGGVGTLQAGDAVGGRDGTPAVRLSVSEAGVPASSYLRPGHLGALWSPPHTRHTCGKRHLLPFEQDSS